MNKRDYIQFNSMRSNIKTLVKAQIISKEQDKGTVWLADNKYLVNQLVDDAARKVVTDNGGKATRKQEVMLDAALGVVQLICNGYKNRFQC